MSSLAAVVSISLIKVMIKEKGVPMSKHFLRPACRALLLALAAIFVWVPATQAQMDPLSRCLADNTTGRDRKDMARWVFVAMSAHPEIHELAATSEETHVKTSQAMGALVTRLLTESCPSEVQAASKDDGSLALRRAFELLGQLAMMELVSDKSVAASFSQFEQYLDRAKINAVIGVD